MPRLAGDIPYRLLGGGQPTQAANRSNSALVNTQSKSHHNASMFFDGVNDAGLIFGIVDLEIANAWTVMVWVAPGNLAPETDQFIYGLGPLSTPKINGIELLIEAGGTFAANLYNTTGTLIKKRSLAADEFFFGTNSWHQIAVTWDGATMKVYRNSAYMNSFMSNEADIGGGQINSSRSITLGSSFYPVVENRMFGLLHSAAHWSEPLTTEAITETYNSGVGGNFDLNLGQGDYTQQANLKSWYQLARTPGEALLSNQAPGGFDLITTQTSERVVNSAPEGSFFDTVGATKFYIENPNLLGVGNAMTIAAWVRPDSLPAEGVTQDVVRFTTLDTDKLALSITTSGGVSYWVYEVSDSTNTITNTVVGTTPVVADAWYHIVGCKNDTFTIRFFVNGLDDVTPIVAGIATTFDVARFTGIAVDLDAVNDPFDGAIDTIALWDVPISEDSVKAVYNGGWRNIDLREVTPSYSEADSLTQWWRFGSTALNEPLRPQQMVPTGFDLTLPSSIEQTDKLKIGTRLMGNCATFDDASGLGTFTALPVGIADTFTISMWLKPENTTTDTQYPLYIGPEQPSTLNSITWRIDGDVSEDPFVVEVISSAGVTIKRVSYIDLLTVDSWQNLTMVWTGSVVSLYRNGTLVDGVVEESNAGSVIDSSRFVNIGGSTRVLANPAGLKFDGRISHVGFWDVELTPNSIRTVSSQAHNLDLRYNKDDYAHAQYLQHYWKLGEDRFLTGRDFMDTTRGSGLLNFTVETGTIPVDGDSPEAVFFVPGWLKSVSLDGGSEVFRNETEQTIDIADTWTLAWWSRATLDFDAPYSAESLLNLNDPSDYRSAVNIYMLNGSGGLSLVTYDDLPGPNILKWYQLDNVWNDNDWHHLAITWDGTDLEIYVDAVQESPSSKVMDNVGSMNDWPRRIGYGGGVIGSPSDNWSGSLGHLAIWNTPLNLANIKEIFDGSHSIDLDSNFGNYIQSVNLEHYWRPGYNDPGLTDEAGTIDFDDAISITEANEQVDAPPQAEASEDRSVLLTGSEFYYNEFNQTIQIANSWTVGFWAKHNGFFPSSSATLIDISNSGNFNSGIYFGMDGLGQISFSTGKTAGAGILWAGVWNYPFNDSDWHHFAFSWDGVAIDMHIDGVYTAASSTSFDGRPGTMADDLREITYGAGGGGAFGEWIGSLGHLGIWNTDLTPAECLEIFSRGHAANLNYNVGNYVSAANLQHYYRPGWVKGPPEETGREDKALLIGSTNDRDFDGTVGIGDDEVVLDAPPHP